MNRVKYSQTDIIKQALENSASRGKLASYRAEFASIAHANKLQEKQGFSQMFVRSFVARKCTPSQKHFDLVDANYKTLHGFEKGSLIDYVIQLHALGFRLYPKAMSAFEFKVSKLVESYEQQYAKQLGEQQSEFSGLGVMSVLNAVSSQVRGKGTDTDVDALITRFNVMFSGKPNPTNEKVISLSSQIAQSIAEQFDTWSAMLSDPVELASIIDLNINQYLGVKTNTANAIEAIIDAKNNVDKDFANATIVFDEDSELYSGDFSDLLVKVASRYSAEAIRLGKSKKAYVNNAVTTTNANGMSWLFGKGIELLSSRSLKELAEQLGVPKDKHDRLKALIQLTKDLNNSSMFTDNAFKGARTSVQAFIDSSVSNHIARLEESVNECRQWAVEDNVSSIEGTHAEEIQSLIASIQQATEMCATSGARLLGGAVFNTDLDDAIAVYKQSRLQIVHAFSQINSFNNVRHQNGESKIELNELAPINLPYFGKQIIDPVKDRQEIQQIKQQLTTEHRQIIDVLVNQYEPTFEKSLAIEEAQQGQYTAKTKRTALKDPKVMARRFFLSRVLTTTYRGSDAFRHQVFGLLKDGNVFDTEESQTELREHIYNKQHFMYVHPLDTKPKKLIRLNEKALLELEFSSLISSLMESVEEGGRDYLNLFGVVSNLLLKSLPDEVETKFIKTETILNHGDYRLLASLENEFIARGDAIHLVNGAYNSQISGINYRLNKSQFVDTKTFKHLVGPRLYYVPKNVSWKVPSHVLKGYKDITKRELLEFNDSGEIDVIESTKALVKSYKQSPSRQIIKFLQQMPHRFCVDAGVASLGVSEYAVLIDEGDVKAAKTVNDLVPICHGKKSEKLKLALNALFDDGKQSPPQLQFERAYRIENDEVVEDKSKRTLRFQMPIKMTTPSQQQIWSPDYILGVDPGEYGLGLSLVNRKGEVKDSCFVNINSVQAYIKSAKQHRQVTMPRQQYKATYSNHLQKAKRSAVADVSRVIDNLILQLNAMPVFEFTKGGTAFESVYQDVINLYTWGDNDAINARRYQHWNSANKWWTDLTEEHACYPGASISGFGSSQTCPHCQRNAVDAAIKLIESGADAVVNGSGELVVHDGVLALEAPDPDTLVERKKKGFSPAWKTAASKKLEGKAVNKAQAMNMVKQSIRRPHENRRAKQGIASLFHCAYKDCAKTGSSEAFAATNHARKYLREKLRIID